MLFNLMSKESDITLKAITLGEYGVGETSFCNLLNKKKFVKNTKQTLGINFETVEYKNNDNIYKLYIWDTSGHPRFERILNLYIKNTKIFFLVFNLSDIKTFNILTNKINLINNYCDNPNILLIGNKFNEKRIEEKIIQDFIKKHKISYLELDCKNNNNIELIDKIYSFFENKKDLSIVKDRSYCKFFDFLF